MFAVLVGVCKNPVARPPMVVSDGTSRNLKRWRDFITDGFQVRNHLFERH